jgi:hypothetical protein
MEQNGMAHLIDTIQTDMATLKIIKEGMTRLLQEHWYYGIFNKIIVLACSRNDVILNSYVVSNCNLSRIF